MQINNIKFPVYIVGPAEPLKKDGILYYAYGKDLGESTEQGRFTIVDDANIDKSSLALRRLELKGKGVNLHKLGKALFFLHDLIKAAKSNLWFIDSEGSLFQYTKNTRVKLIFRPIEQVIPITTGGAIIVVKGIPCRYKVLFPPDATKTHVGLLVLKNSYLLYGLFDQEYDATYRVI